MPHWRFSPVFIALFLTLSLAPYAHAENVATASMVSNDTGIPQKNICRYKRDLEKAGRLWEIEKNLCRRTGYKAWYLTTNPDKASNNNQLNLF